MATSVESENKDTVLTVEVDTLVEERLATLKQEITQEMTLSVIYILGNKISAMKKTLNPKSQLFLPTN